ncbi:MFS transporter [Candidatus Woesearchaeota archaeon]|nr:MFS transporter [Candidatus Woesearchaeota archaeon]
MIDTREAHDGKIKKIFFGMEFINGIRRTIFFTLALLYFISLGHDPVKVVAMFAVSRIILAAVEFPTGAFADYYSRKKSIVLSFFIMGIGLSGFFFTSNFWMLSFFYILQDIGWSFQSGTTTAWAIDSLKYGKEHNKITSLMARFFFFERSGAIIGGFIGFVLVAIEFRLVWLVIGLMCIITSAALAKVMPEEPMRKKGKKAGLVIGTFLQAKESVKYIFHRKNSELQGIALGTFIGVIAINAFYIEAPLILTQIIGLTPENISGIKGMIGFAILIAPFIVERFAHKIGFRRGLSSTFLGLFTGIIVFALSKNVIITVIAWAAMYVLDNIASISIDSAIQHRLTSQNRATLGSAMNAVWSVADASASGLVSLGLLLIGLVNTTLLSGCLCIVAAFVYFARLKF